MRGYPSPTTNTLTGITDLGAETITFRINGTQVASSAIIGGGSFRNDIVYIGGRAASNLFIDAPLYGLVVLGKLPTSDEIAWAEGLMNDAAMAYPTSIEHIEVYGQSLSIGIGSTPGLTTTQPYSNIMPNGGVIDGTFDDQGITSAPTSTSFVPLAFATQSTLGESIGLGGANLATSLLNASSPKNHKQNLVSSAGRGGTAIAPFLKGGGSYYAYVTAQAALYAARAAALGRSYAMRSVWWMQGETDSTNNLPRATYKAGLKSLIDDLNADISQDKPIKLLTYQMASHTVRGGGRPPEIALAQLEASREHDNIALVTPMYHVPYNGDSVHLPNHSERWIGQYFGKVHHKVCSLNQDWRPLEPTGATISGNTVDISFHVPVTPLVLDTVRVTDPGDYGFEVIDAGTSAVLGVASVSLNGSTGVRIILDATPSAPVRVRYAYGANGWPTGPTEGARGCLRDSDTTPSLYNDAGGNPYELFNWCVIFNEVVM